MAAGQYDITMDRGVYYEVTFVLKDENEDAIDITGYTFKSQIKRSGNPKVEQEFTTAITNAATGSVRISLTGDKTRKLPAEPLIYDLVAKDSTDILRKYVEGKVALRETTTDTSGL
jgi:hypothetical protein